MERESHESSYRDAAREARAVAELRIRLRAGVDRRTVLAATVFVVLGLPLAAALTGLADPRLVVATSLWVPALLVAISRERALVISPGALRIEDARGRVLARHPFPRSATLWTEHETLHLDSHELLARVKPAGFAERLPELARLHARWARESEA